MRFFFSEPGIYLMLEVISNMAIEPKPTGQNLMRLPDGYVTFRRLAVRVAPFQNESECADAAEKAT
jgi:hypothetical protein